jgi:flagellar motor switch/type III secretory pathway protein FliN
METEALPYLVLGDSRRALLAQKLRGVITEWGRRWVGELQPTVVVEPAVPKARAGSDAPSHDCCVVDLGSQQRPRMHILCPATLLPALLGARHTLPDISSACARAPIAAALQSELLESLGNYLARAAGEADLPVHVGRWSAHCLDQPPPRKRWIAVTVSFDGIRPALSLLLDSQLAARFAPGAPSVERRDGLAKRRAAIRAAAARVEVVLGDAEVEFAQLTDLAIGDVVVLNQALTSPAQLYSANGARIGAVQLGQVGAQLAVSMLNSAR